MLTDVLRRAGLRGWRLHATSLGSRAIGLRARGERADAAILLAAEARVQPAIRSS